jgi:hypothetical protein
MSDTTPTVRPALDEPVPPATAEPVWAKPSISVIGLLIFAIGYAIAFVVKDSTVQTMYAGAAIAIGQQIIGYWIGSSAGSTKKDQTIAAHAEALAAVTASVVQLPAPPISVRTLP